MIYSNDSIGALYACERERTGNYGEDSYDDHDNESVVVSTEYAVEIRNEKGFVEQIDIFETYDDAEDFYDNYDVSELNEGEYLDIIFIDYNEYGDEIDFGTVC